MENLPAGGQSNQAPEPRGQAAGYPTVEAIHAEADMMRLADSSGLGIKKARQIKHAVGVYLEEEAKLRTDLDSEKARTAQGSAGA